MYLSNRILVFNVFFLWFVSKLQPTLFAGNGTLNDGIACKANGRSGVKTTNQKCTDLLQRGRSKTTWTR